MSAGYSGLGQNIPLDSFLHGFVIPSAIMIRTRKFAAFVVATILCVAVATAGVSYQATIPQRVLFIGDSFTYFQDGVYTHFEKLAAAATPPIKVQTDKSVFGGAYLHRLWDLREPVQAINKGTADVVVIQEDIPETNVADFREYARKFVSEIRKNNARPVLFMAWAYNRLGWISMAEIAQAHRDAAKELNVDVAPVGLAWMEASRQRPAMDFYAPDREHPNIFGTYLATCTIYATVYNRDPSGIPYAPAGITAEQAAFLQNVSWRSVQEFRK